MGWPARGTRPVSSAKTRIGWLQTAYNRERKLALEQAEMPVPFRGGVLQEIATDNFADAVRAVQAAARDLADVERADRGGARLQVAQWNLGEAHQAIRDAVAELRRLDMIAPPRPEGWLKFCDAKGEPCWRYAGPGQLRTPGMPEIGRAHV